MRANLCPAQTGEERFRLIGASHAVRIGLAMVDALGLIGAMQRIPIRGFVGMDHSTSLDVLADQRHARSLACALGVMDSEPNIRNKLAQGKFTAVFLVQCLEAIGARELRL